jgi:hypothetical protein
MKICFCLANYHEILNTKKRFTTRNIKNWAESDKYEHFNNK